MFHLQVGILTTILNFQNFHKAQLLCKAKIFFFENNCWQNIVRLKDQ